MARGKKLTEERIKKICGYVRQGLTYEVAARLAGIHPATFYRWKARGQKAKKGIYKKFWDALQEADAEAEAALLKEVRKEKGGPRWIMERRWPERWGQRVDVKLEGMVFALDWGVEADEDDADDPAAGDSGEDAADASPAA